ncbi:hypothetical protein AZ16_0361 [Bordetella bronchiseptica B18-5 (C3)]|nr:hypothetical protein AZ16_0361 [Bordetella bronchiseptica B18-5 (C3)]KDD90797.1 hypothetical protein L524_2055 [Bordetella bronchiseptica MBORD762]
MCLSPHGDWRTQTPGCLSPPGQAPRHEQAPPAGPVRSAPPPDHFFLDRCALACLEFPTQWSVLLNSPH